MHGELISMKIPILIFSDHIIYLWCAHFNQNIMCVILSIQLTSQWCNFGLGHPLAKKASQDGAPLKIFTDLPLSNFEHKFSPKCPPPYGAISYATGACLHLPN